MRTQNEILKTLTRSAENPCAYVNEFPGWRKRTFKESKVAVFKTFSRNSRMFTERPHGIYIEDTNYIMQPLYKSKLKKRLD